METQTLKFPGEAAYLPIDTVASTGKRAVAHVLALTIASALALALTLTLALALALTGQYVHCQLGLNAVPPH